ncbi:MAG TPA: DUF4410 domain-containing protein [Bacillota bacterium]|nr:DUF4410 domain-containing protein [Bacillota bacterium]
MNSQLTVLLLAFVLLTGCKSAKVTGEQEFAPGDTARPAIVYVADFDLGVQNIQNEEGPLASRPGPLGQVGKRLAGDTQDPEVRARKLVDLMANSIVQGLAKAGFTATRLAPGKPLPAQGWLVRGVFTEVQEGNRLRRAMVGMGTGQTDLQVVTKLDDLSQGPPKPLYELDTEASSGQAPGAAPTIALMGPYGAAARFVMAGHDLEKNVKQTASQIAAHVAQRVGQTKGLSR